MTADGDPGSITGAARRPVSLRLRLTLFSLLTLAVSLGLVGLALDSAFRSSSESDLQQQMETWAYLALGAAEVSEDGRIEVSGVLGDPLLGQPGSGVYVHVHGRDDHWSSPSALGVELPELEGVSPGTTLFEPPGQAGAFYTFQYGVAWELEDQSVLPFTVSVLVASAWIQPQLVAFRAGLWQSLGAAGAILALAQFLFFAFALRPLRKVAVDVSRIESGQSETLAGPYPRELEPLTRNLDRLLATEKANQARYRNALDSLAHSLKTPLAVIRSGMHGSEIRDAGAMDQAVDDMQHLIASRLERAAAGTRRTLGSTVAVEPVARRLERSLRKVHSQVLQNLSVSIEPGLKFQGEERDLLEVLGNLLDNACKYGKGSVWISAGELATEHPRPGLWLQVENDGEPPQAGRFEAMLQRGVRGDERVEGHGLGLTIVSEVVSAYGGEMRFSVSEHGGARVRVELPPR
jgi:two-component system sensor histidine kinase PhoQ